MSEIAKEALEQWRKLTIRPESTGLDCLRLMNIKDALIDALESLQQENRWIPVSERLPESGRTVLLGLTNCAGKWRSVRGEYSAKFSVEVDYEEYEGGEYNEANDTYYRPEGFFEVPLESEYIYDLSNVTHWRPLPPAPKEDV